METKEFLESVLGQDGFYCIFAANQKTQKVQQSFFGDLGQAIKTAEYLDSEGNDTYFALSTFKTDHDRTVKNVQEICSLFLDIDCGESKEYATQHEGLEALNQFRKEAGLPVPSLVDSGRGIHAYWTLTEPVTYDRWLPVAQRLKAKCNELGFFPDAAVTADAARVLRVPKTHNYKDTPPRCASVIGHMQPPVDFEWFSNTLGKPPVPIMSPEMKANTSALMAMLRGNMECRFKLIMEKTVAGRGCEQLGIIATQQADIDEPLWRAGLSIAKFCSDGGKSAHKISCNHPEYSYDKTEAKMSTIKGPYLCERFDEFNPGVCGNCPKKGKIKSPIVLGSELREPKDDGTVVAERHHEPVQGEIVEEEYHPSLVSLPAPPRPYKRGENGGIYLTTLDKDGDPVNEVIYQFDIAATQLLKDPELGISAVIRVHLPMEGIREFTVPLETVTDVNGLKRALARQGVVSPNQRGLAKLIEDWVMDLQMRTKEDDACIQFGWTKNRDGFVLGDKVYRAGAPPRINHPSSKTLQFFPSLEPVGTMEGWKQAMDIYGIRGMEMYQYVIGTGFGSILMELIPNVQAGGMHIYGKGSGQGKTTAMWAAASIWGDYQELVIRAGDTLNFAFNRFEIYKNIPAYTDEVTNADPLSLSNYALSLTQGKQRGRLTQSANVERLRGELWGFIGVSTGNTSIAARIGLAKAGCEAEMMRIMECHAPNFLTDVDMTQVDTDLLNELMSQNYGHAAPPFIQYVLDHPMEVVKYMTVLRNKVRSTFKLVDKHRFWVAKIVATLTGIHIANKLGLVNFPEAPIWGFVKQMVHVNLRQLSQAHMDTPTTIGDYLNEFAADILVIREGHMPAELPRGNIAARYEPDKDRLVIPVSKFRKWCDERQLGFTAMRDELVDGKLAQVKPTRLFSGTDKASMPVTRCLDIFDCRTIAVPKDDEET